MPSLALICLTELVHRQLANPFLKIFCSSSSNIGWKLMMRQNGQWHLLSDTGMALCEAAVLSKEDVHLDADIPYVKIRPYNWRRLKTKSSVRKLFP